MSTDERCTCCDLPAYSCGRALERQRDADHQASRPSTIEATWPGRCGGCGQHFDAGEPITPGDLGEPWLASCCS